MPLPILTTHARTRAQQRGIPPLIQSWLLDYGDRAHDHRGAVLRFFSKRSLRRLEQAAGHLPVRQHAEYLRSYLVQAINNGAVITIGKRYPGQRLPR